MSQSSQQASPCPIYVVSIYIDVSKNRGTIGVPKMDGENNGTPYWNGWFGGTIIFGNTHIDYNIWAAAV